MSTENCSRIEHSLWRYIDRELPAKEISAISGHLRTCDACQQIYEETAREAKLYRLGFEDAPFGEPFVQRFRRRFARESAGRVDPSVGSVVLQGKSWWDSVRGWIYGAGPSGSITGRRLLQLGTLAAVLFIIPGLIFLAVESITPDVELIGSYQRVRGGVKYMIEGGKTGKYLRTTGEYPLRPGSRFELQTGAMAEIRLGDGDRDAAVLELAGPAIFTVSSSASLDRFHARLGRGRLRAVVEPRTPGETFDIETPDAVARVVGTEFVLEVVELETRLRVDEGAVALASKHGRGTVPGSEARVVPESGWYRIPATAAPPEPFDVPEGTRSDPEGGTGDAGSPPPASGVGAAPAAEAPSGPLDAPVEAPPGGETGGTSSPILDVPVPRDAPAPRGGSRERDLRLDHPVNP